MKKQTYSKLLFKSLSLSLSVFLSSFFWLTFYLFDSPTFFSLSLLLSDFLSFTLFDSVSISLSFFLTLLWVSYLKITFIVDLYICSLYYEPQYLCVWALIKTCVYLQPVDPRTPMSVNSSSRDSPMTTPSSSVSSLPGGPARYRFTPNLESTPQMNGNGHMAGKSIQSAKWFI